MDALKIVESVPPVSDFCRIRIAAGLSARSEEAARRGLPNSLYGIHVLLNQTVIAMGRVVGDGACNFEIVDVAVVPEHQGQGIGRMIMKRIMAFLEVHAPSSACISLIGDVPPFYEPFGFKDCKPSRGMIRHVP